MGSSCAADYGKKCHRSTIPNFKLLPCTGTYSAVPRRTTKYCSVAIITYHKALLGTLHHKTPLRTTKYCSDSILVRNSPYHQGLQTSNAHHTVLQNQTPYHNNTSFCNLVFGTEKSANIIFHSTSHDNTLTLTFDCALACPKAAPLPINPFGDPNKWNVWSKPLRRVTPGMRKRMELRHSCLGIAHMKRPSHCVTTLPRAKQCFATTTCTLRRSCMPSGAPFRAQGVKTKKQCNKYTETRIAEMKKVMPRTPPLW